MKNDNNPNVSKTKDAVTDLNKKLDNIIKGAETASAAIGNDAKDPIGNIASGTAGGIVGGEVNKLVEGIKSIVEVVLKEGNHEAGTEKKS